MFQTTNQNMSFWKKNRGAGDWYTIYIHRSDGKPIANGLMFSPSIYQPNMGKGHLWPTYTAALASTDFQTFEQSSQGLRVVDVASHV